MESQRKQVAIELHTTIDDNGQMEYNTIKQDGYFYTRDSLDVLTFDEISDDGFTIKNLITIQTNKVSIKRTGSIAMLQKFQAKQLTENIFKHPHGNLHMETFTTSMNYQPITKGKQARLTLDYSVKINGQEARKHHLTLTFTEEAVH